MADVVSIRMEDSFLRKIDKLGNEEDIDRSTLIRNLIRKGYKILLKEKAANLYKEGKITMSEAAHRSGLTLWEMEHFLLDSGFKSEYSIEDLEREIRLLDK